MAPPDSQHPQSPGDPASDRSLGSSLPSGLAPWRVIVPPPAPCVHHSLICRERCSLSPSLAGLRFMGGKSSQMGMSLCRNSPESADWGSRPCSCGPAAFQVLTSLASHLRLLETHLPWFQGSVWSWFHYGWQRDCTEDIHCFFPSLLSLLLICFWGRPFIC